MSKIIVEQDAINILNDLIRDKWKNLSSLKSISDVQESEIEKLESVREFIGRGL